MLSRDLDPSQSADTSWSQRIFALIWYKAIGSTVVISGFFVAYFYVMNHPVFPVRVMPALWIDHWTPVIPLSAWVYFSLWVYICLPSSLMGTVSELAYYLRGTILLGCLGLLVFYLYPTAVPVWEIDWTQYPTLLFLKESDASGNACPSLHVAFSVFSGLWFSRMLAYLSAPKVWHVVNLLWCCLIIVSTMTTKQHVFIDVFCGMIVGWAIFPINDWISRKGWPGAYANFRTAP